MSKPIYELAEELHKARYELLELVCGRFVRFLAKLLK